jgi:DNA-binding CsgD family transcriptional regulator
VRTFPIQVPASLCGGGSSSDTPHISTQNDDPSTSLPARVELEQAGLTSDEIEMVPLLAENLSFAEIGAALGIDRAMVDACALSIYRKLGVTPLSGAIEPMAEPPAGS